MASKRLRIFNISQLVTVCKNGEKIIPGSKMDKVEIIENGAIVVDTNGIIEAVGKTSDILEQYKSVSFDKDIDATGKSVIPGLVDCHTHPVWSGDRVHEFKMKLDGASYMEVHKAGGGISFTVRHTQASSQEELEELLKPRLDKMLKLGTTLAECKSGYGLDGPTEMKMLKALHKVGTAHPIDFVGTYLGAHSVPQGMTSSQATEDIVTVQIPMLKKLIDSEEVTCTMVDVFLEKNVFSNEEAKQILLAGKNIGLDINFHGDELSYQRSGELAAELGAKCMSHCEWLSEKAMEEMAKKNVVAVLLPTTPYVLRIEPPNARKMMEKDTPVALGSDFNPNAYCLSMPFTMNIACITMKMTMNEALIASTINSAAAIGKSDTHGSLEIGKVGDLLLIDAPRWEHLIYQMGSAPIETVFLKGQDIQQLI
eukprot:GCRY01002814.1.p1 GENE.GCRY01002814.1~~GCRY01002814.1.p1  ORF type:complete len:451 (+),score=44.99 GCRY01002814.1:80-1354(+)